ncbi:MAG TPA: aryl-sulfate sulfotransferase [Bacteroidales bacterium]|nr:aryl-sulfate sulfotransferase [Bacteroidales bacterium]HPS18382.1 aryl-sulfate sulfotransferase [Bacteroidales bacterium]
MKKHFLLTIFAVCFWAIPGIFAQQQESYTFCANSSYTYLLDTNATTSSSYYQRFNTGTTSYCAHFYHDTIYTTSGSGSAAGGYGSVKKYAWTGNNTVSSTWTYTVSGAHHDICPMPNGNVLIIVDETINLSTYGGSSTSVSSPIIKEIKPTGTTTGTVVWEWHLKNHLCQTTSSSNTYATYVTDVKQHPELFYVGCTTNGGVTSDWFHANGIDYNPTLDQIVWCSHIKNEIYVIDHSTTTAQAATHAGGNSGKGGDFLYRWGSPENYGCTTDGNGVSLSIIHDARWVPATNSVWPNYISVFHNGGCKSGKGCVLHLPTYSTTDPYNYTYTAGSVVGPTTAVTPTTKSFDVQNQGGCMALDNGNVLITSPNSAFYETRNSSTPLQSITVGTIQSDRLKKVEVFGPWFLTASIPSVTHCANSAISLTFTKKDAPVVTSPTYTYSWSSSPSTATFSSTTAQNPTVTPTAAGNYTFTVTVTMTGTFNSTTITTTTTASVTAVVDACTDVQENPIKGTELNLFPNPTTGTINLNDEFTEDNNFEVFVYNSYGEIIIQEKNSKLLDLSAYSNGIYYITVKSENKNIVNKKIVIMK